MTNEYQEKLEALIGGLKVDLFHGCCRNEDCEDCDGYHPEQDNSDEKACADAVAAITALNAETIGEHLFGCPSITRYVGPEGTPYDGPACDCDVLDLRNRFGIEKETK